MTGNAKEFSTTANSITPKAECFEYAYKMIKGSASVEKELNRLWNKVILIEEYQESITHQNFVCALICKPKSQKRKRFEKNMIKENKKTNNSYNTLLKILNIKNKQFQQVYYNSYLREQNVRVLQSKEYNINKCQELIKKSTNEKLK